MKVKVKEQINTKDDFWITIFIISLAFTIASFMISLPRQETVPFGFAIIFCGFTILSVIGIWKEK